MIKLQIITIYEIYKKNQTFLNSIIPHAIFSNTQSNYTGIRMIPKDATFLSIVYFRMQKYKWFQTAKWCFQNCFSNYSNSWLHYKKKTFRLSKRAIMFVLSELARMCLIQLIKKDQTMINMCFRQTQLITRSILEWYFFNSHYYQ